MSADSNQVVRICSQFHYKWKILVIFFILTNPSIFMKFFANIIG